VCVVCCNDRHGQHTMTANDDMSACYNIDDRLANDFRFVLLRLNGLSVNCFCRALCYIVKLCLLLVPILYQIPRGLPKGSLHDCSNKMDKRLYSIMCVKLIEVNVVSLS